MSQSHHFSDSEMLLHQVIIMGATNRPQDLDSAILRRMPTRFHINQPVRTTSVLKGQSVIFLSTRSKLSHINRDF